METRYYQSVHMLEECKIHVKVVANHIYATENQLSGAKPDFECLWAVHFMVSRFGRINVKGVRTH